MRSVAAVLTCILPLAVLAACGSPGGSRAPVSARCSPVSESLQAKIMLGVKVSGMMSSAYAVQSTDVGDIEWGQFMMVAAEIDGAGLEGTGDIGVWAVAEIRSNFDGSSMPPGHYAIFTVNELAKQLGSAPGEGGWTDGSEQGYQFPVSADGVAEAVACAKAG